MLTARLAIGVAAHQENGARGAVHYRDWIHEGVGALAAHERLHRQPGSAAVDAAFQHHVRGAGVANALLARLAEDQHRVGRRQHHRRDTVGVHAVLPGDEDIGHHRLPCCCANDQGRKKESSEECERGFHGSRRSFLGLN
jgi:hypothetical protein